MKIFGQEIQINTQLAFDNNINMENQRNSSARFTRYNFSLARVIAVYNHR